MEASLLKEFIKYFILIQLVGQCCCIDKCHLELSDPKWVNNWNVYIEDVGNHRFQLARTPYVAKQKQIFGRCNNDNPPHSLTCDNNLQLTKNPRNPAPCTADKALRAVRIDATVRYCRYTFFKIGFKFKILDRKQFVEAYQVCFDKIHMRPLYTINKAYPRGVKHPDFLKFYPNSIIDDEIFQKYSHDSQLKTLNKLLGPNPSYSEIPNNQNFVSRGQLTPGADFSMTNPKSATYDMLNVIPQFESIRTGNWRRIENWARQLPNSPSNICTGVLNCDLDSKDIKDLDCVLQLKNTKGQPVPMFLGDNRQIPIPLWTYKIVKNAKIAFLTLNNIYHVGPVPVPQRLCKERKCPSDLSKDFGSVKLGWTFCCEHKHFIEKNVKHLKRVC